MAHSKDDEVPQDENTENQKNAEEVIEEIDGEETPSIGSWEDKYAALEKEVLYQRAEFDNYKRNVIKDRAQLLKFGAQRLAQDLLDTVDVFSQALAGDITKDNFENFVEGVRMTQQQLQQTLEKHGIKEVDVIGKNFDPATQEALGTEHVENFETGQVCRVFKAPFTYHDKLLRAGQVFVAQAPTAPSEEVNE